MEREILIHNTRNNIPSTHYLSIYLHICVSGLVCVFLSFPFTPPNYILLPLPTLVSYFSISLYLSHTNTTTPPLFFLLIKYKNEQKIYTNKKHLYLGLNHFQKRIKECRKSPYRIKNIAMRCTNIKYET